MLDSISSVQFTNFTVSGVGSYLKLNGSIDDPVQARTFCESHRAELSRYDALKLLERPVFSRMLPKETQESLKETKVEGIHKRPSPSSNT